MLRHTYEILLDLFVCALMLLLIARIMHVTRVLLPYLQTAALAARMMAPLQVSIAQPAWAHDKDEKVMLQLLRCIRAILLHTHLN